MECYKSKNWNHRKHNFYEKYIKYCKSKVVRPLPLPKKSQQKYLEVCGDRIDVNNCLAIIDALSYDDSLLNISIKLRRALQVPIAHINSLNKLRKFPCQVPIGTKILFTGLVRSISQSLCTTQTLTSLTLEGLPLLGHYTHLLLEGLSQNHSVEHLCFDRSALGDDGFEALCSSIKYSPNVESLSACQCDLTHKSCEALATLITSQCVYRFSEGWMHSLRYRSVDVKSIRGIKRIALNGNALIGDKGIQRIVDALIDDEWIDSIEFRECGLSNDSGDLILGYLKKVGPRMIFDVTRNKLLSKHCADEILASNTEHSNEPVLSGKELIHKLGEEIECLRSQLNTEILNRMRSDELNAQLKCEFLKEKIEKETTEIRIPNGFVLIKKESLEALRARDQLAREAQAKLRKRRIRLSKSIFTQKRTNKIHKFTDVDHIGDAKPPKNWKTVSEKSAHDARALFFGSSETPSIESDCSDSDQEVLT